LHIGSVRTALFCWLYARHHKGTFVLRIEDTDRERSTDEAVQVILDGMAWTGLLADEGPFYQTKRMDRYREVIDGLLSEGKAYKCYCSREELDAMRERQMAAKAKPRYDGTCRHRQAPREGVDPVVRFKNPTEGNVLVEDAIHGNVVFDNNELDDLIIARSDGTPTYNFCVVVDDMDMQITHVIRGDDHLNNTPRQINMLRALGAKPPVYAHLPMILGPDGAKMSKRHGAASVLTYREEGYLPEALLNYLARLGWSHGDQEIFSLEEMAALFDIEGVNKSAAAFSPEKLAWVNQQHIQRAPAEHLAEHLRPQLAALGIEVTDTAKLAAVAAVQRERAKTLKEMAQKSVFFFKDVESYDPKAAKKNLGAAALPTLEAIHAALSAVTEWAPTAIHDVVTQVAAARGIGMGDVAQPIRVAVTGTAVSPPIDTTLTALGREPTLARIARACDWIRQQASAQ
jgi:glutamyl-tRNA synthetase